MIDDKSIDEKIEAMYNKAIKNLGTHKARLFFWSMRGEVRKVAGAVVRARLRGWVGDENEHGR